MGEAAKTAVPALLEKTTHPEFRIRIRAWSTLRYIDPTAAPPLSAIRDVKSVPLAAGAVPEETVAEGAP